MPTQKMGIEELKLVILDLYPLSRSYCSECTGGNLGTSEIPDSQINPCDI